MKVKRITALLLSTFIAAANSGITAPIFNTNALDETYPVSAEALQKVKDCSLRISVIDGETGEYYDDVDVYLMSNPNGTSVCVSRWNTSEEAVKTISGLYAEDNFFIDVQPLSKSNMIYGEEYVTFDHYGQTKNIVLKVFPWKPLYECNVPVTIYDWTHCTDNFDTSISLSNEMLNDNASIGIFDENGDFYESFDFYTGESAIYLPDGKYTMKMYRSRDYHLVSADSEKAKLAKEKYNISVPESDEVEFEVKDGVPDKNLEVFYEKYGEDSPKNNLTFHAVDSVTGEDIKGICFDLTSDDTGYGYRWDTSERTETVVTDVSEGRYTLRTIELPSEYMPDFTVEADPNDSIGELYYTAGKAHFNFEAENPSDVTLKFKPLRSNMGDCSANISLVDMKTGTNIEGAKLSLIMNPTATGEKLGEWNSSDESVKNFTDLFKNAYYGVYVNNYIKGYDIDCPRFFSFDSNWEEKDIVLRAVSQNTKHNVNIVISDFTDMEIRGSGVTYEGDKIFHGNASVTVYDKNGDYFCSVPTTGYDSMYLPDGEYTATLSVIDKGYNVISRDWNFAKKVIECYPDMKIPYKEGVHFKVVDGKPNKVLGFFVTQKENDTDEPAVNGSFRLSVIDGRTGGPVDGVKIALSKNAYEAETVAKWDTTVDDEIFIDGLEAGEYNINIYDLPDKYDYSKTVFINCDSFNIDKENTKFETTFIICPKDCHSEKYLRVHDITGVEKDSSGSPVYRYSQSSTTTPLSEYDDIKDEFVEIRGANNGKVYYQRVSTMMDIVLPDGNYTATLLDDDGKYVPAAPQSEKLRLLMSVKDYPEGVCGFTTEFSIKEGQSYGKTDLYVYERNSYDSMHLGTCVLNVKVVDATNEKVVPNCGMIVEYAPERQFDTVDSWNTKDTPQMAVKGLFPSVDYRITPYMLSEDYVPLKERSVKFSKNNEIVDVVFRAIPTSKVVKGDSNGDGGVDMADVVMIMQALANPNKYQLSEIGSYNADMDGNGVTVGDAQKIQRILLGLDKN